MIILHQAFETLVYFVYMEKDEIQKMSAEKLDAQYSDIGTGNDGLYSVKLPIRLRLLYRQNRLNRPKCTE